MSDGLCIGGDAIVLLIGEIDMLGLKARQDGLDEI